MKKSSVVAMVLGTVGGIFLALGMCMALLPEWNAFIPGVVMGVVGILVILATVAIWRRMEHKPAIKISGKTIGEILFGVIGVLFLGVGMSLVMVYNIMVVGILLGIVGIVLLICLIPMIMGIQ